MHLRHYLQILINRALVVSTGIHYFCNKNNKVKTNTTSTISHSNACSLTFSSLQSSVPQAIAKRPHNCFLSSKIYKLKNN